MTTLDKARFTYKAFNDPLSFEGDMINAPKKDRTINSPKQIVVLMTNIFCQRKQISEEEHYMNEMKMTPQMRLEYLLEKSKKRKWQQNPIIRLVNSLEVYY